MTNDSSAIRAIDLSVEKQHVVILPGLTFMIEPGMITGLIGPSGSGKTTLMRAIVGVQRITSGKLEVFGRSAGDVSLRTRIGYVTQSPAVYGDLTVLQNIQYFAKLSQANQAQVHEVIQTVHLDDKKDQLVASMSGGQQARVSLAIALLGNPELLVLDEPTVGLDPILRQELWDLFAELADRGKTILVSSHVMDEADRCSQLVMLHEGKLVWNDTRQALLADTATSSVEAAFVTKLTRKVVL